MGGRAGECAGSAARADAGAGTPATPTSTRATRQGGAGRLTSSWRPRTCQTAGRGARGVRRRRAADQRGRSPAPRAREPAGAGSGPLPALPRRQPPGAAARPAHLDGVKGQVAQQEGAVAGKDAAPPLLGHNVRERRPRARELACAGMGGGGRGRARGGPGAAGPRAVGAPPSARPSCSTAVAGPECGSTGTRQLCSAAGAAARTRLHARLDHLCGHADQGGGEARGHAARQGAQELLLLAHALHHVLRGAGGGAVGALGRAWRAARQARQAGKRAAAALRPPRPAAACCARPQRLRGAPRPPAWWARTRP